MAVTAWTPAGRRHPWPWRRVCHYRRGNLLRSEEIPRRGGFPSPPEIAAHWRGSHGAASRTVPNGTAAAEGLGAPGIRVSR